MWQLLTSWFQNLVSNAYHLVIIFHPKSVECHCYEVGPRHHWKFFYIFFALSFIRSSYDVKLEMTLPCIEITHV